jgi:putative ABC exporter
MIAALIYLQANSFRNRVRSWLKRLKHPKYLAGAVVGGAYFYFYFFRHLFTTPDRRAAFGTVSPEMLSLLESLAAALLLVIILMAWVVPHERAALTFTEAEIAFLFPAPISRRGLIHFKLLRSQFRIFVTIFFLTLVSNRLGGSAWIHAAGWWLVLSALNLHLLGSSFARTMLLDRGITNWQRRSVILGILAVLAIAVFLWGRKTFPPLNLAALENFADGRDYVHQLLESGPIPYLLFPFRLVVQPYFAPDPAAFLRVLGPAVLLIALQYWWVVRANVAFEEASLEVSQKLAARIASVRAGNWQNAGRPGRKRRAPFSLKPLGFPPMALFWKNLISAGQMFTLRLWIFLAIIAGVMLISSGIGRRGSDLMSVVAMIGGMLLIWSVLFGPQLLRQDLRQDLVHADVLKLFPLRGWQIVVGEMLAPVAILTGIQWLLVIVASMGLWKIPHVTPPLAFAIIVSTALLLPALNAVMLLIPNAGVLVFPGWFQTGKDGPQGIEATGQRLIMMLGQLLALAVALVPAVVIFVVIFLIGKIFVAPAAVILPASVAATIVLVAEAWIGVMLLGKVFEQFDLSVELSS